MGYGLVWSRKPRPSQQLGRGTARPTRLGSHTIPPRKDPHQAMPSHPYVQYALLTALYLLFRLDPQSAQAAAAALPLWEAINPTGLPLLPTERR